jgi:hypothetical protein
VALVDMLYRKSLRVSSAAKGELGAGTIVNLQSNDACEYLHPVCVGSERAVLEACTTFAATAPAALCCTASESMAGRCLRDC